MSDISTEQDFSSLKYETGNPYCSADPPSHENSKHCWIDAFIGFISKTRLKINAKKNRSEKNQGNIEKFRFYTCSK